MKIPRLNILYFFTITIIFQLVYTSRLTSEDSAVKIMPLGDSITWGTDPEAESGNRGYRKYLYNFLTSEGYNIDFVGSEKAGSPDDFDRDNEGHRGMYAFSRSRPDLSLRDNILEYLSNNRPDIVLLHIGTNDLASRLEPKSVDSTANDVIKLLEIIHNFDPNIFTVLALIIKRIDKDGLEDSTQFFNKALREKAGRLIAEGRKITIVDMEPVLSYPEDISASLVHPNKQGFRKMAAVWLGGILEILTPRLASPLNKTAVMMENIALKWKPAIGADSYRLQVSADSMFTNIILDDSTFSNFMVIKSLEKGREYFWRVRGKINNGNSPYSSAGSFYTESIESINLAGK